MMYMKEMGALCPGFPYVLHIALALQKTKHSTEELQT